MQLAIPLRTYKGMRTLREQAALFERYRGFDRCMRKLSFTEGQPVPLGPVAELYAHWGDPLSQSSESYLRSCLAQAMHARGAIVQCGASLLTLVLGKLCNASQHTAKQLWCLEHDAHWANTVRSWLTQYRVGSTHVITSRAHMFEGYVWYAVDTARLADQVSLVLCDGARATPSGILGTLTRLDGRLALDCTILARKVSRMEDLRELNLWAKSHDAACVIVDRQEGFVKVSLRSSAHASQVSSRPDPPGASPAA
jgi:hypothetical protein